MKTGVVSAVDAATGKCRVQFADQDNVESYWLPVLQRKTGQDKCYHMPDVGEHVACLMDDHDEFGVIAGAFYSDADQPPASSGDKFHMAFSDGTSLEYDRASHTLTANIQGQAVITATGGVEIHGDLTVNGSITTTGDVNASGRVIDGGGNTNHHTH
ncbi:MAG: phage baseplate assembly protein V [Desulfobulbus sp.]